MHSTINAYSSRHPRKSDGFTLVELMIGMVVGLSVLGTVAALFVPSLQSFRSGEALSQIQENQRYVISSLSQAIDQAGYIGCDSTAPENVINVTDLPAATAWVSAMDTPVRIFSPGQNSDAAINDPTRREDSGVDVGDVLTLLTSSTSSAILVGHDPAAEEISFRNDLVSRLDNEMILINDCTNSALFEVANGVYDNGTNTTTFSYAAEDTNNCDAVAPARVLLGTDGGGEPSCTDNQFYSEYTFNAGANATSLIAQSLYIAPSLDRDGNDSPINNSLYSIQMDSTGGYSPPIELMVGVDNFRARYGVLGSDGNIYYLTGNAFTGDLGADLGIADLEGTFDDVAAVEITLMLGSTSTRGERVSEGSQNLDFPNAAGVMQECGESGSGVAYTSACPSYLRSTVSGVNLERRIRRVVSKVYNLRNKVI